MTEKKVEFEEEMQEDSKTESKEEKKDPQRPSKERKVSSKKPPSPSVVELPGWKGSGKGSGKDSGKDIGNRLEFGLHGPRQEKSRIQEMYECCKKYSRLLVRLIFSDTFIRGFAFMISLIVSIVTVVLLLVELKDDDTIGTISIGEWGDLFSCPPSSEPWRTCFAIPSVVDIHDFLFHNYVTKNSTCCSKLVDFTTSYDDFPAGWYFFAATAIACVLSALLWLKHIIKFCWNIFLCWRKRGKVHSRDDQADSDEYEESLEKMELQLKLSFNDKLFRCCFNCLSKICDQEKGIMMPFFDLIMSLVLFIFAFLRVPVISHLISPAAYLDHNIHHIYDKDKKHHIMYCTLKLSTNWLEIMEEILMAVQLFVLFLYGCSAFLVICVNRQLKLQQKTTMEKMRHLIQEARNGNVTVEELCDKVKNNVDMRSVFKSIKGGDAETPMDSLNILDNVGKSTERDHQNSDLKPLIPNETEDSLDDNGDINIEWSPNGSDENRDVE